MNSIPYRVPQLDPSLTSARKDHLSERNKLSMALFYMYINEVLEYLCSGVLITLRHVLTVKECFLRFNKNPGWLRIHVRVDKFQPNRYHKFKHSSCFKVNEKDIFQIIFVSSCAYDAMF